jgi:hypothetical protein
LSETIPTLLDAQCFLSLPLNPNLDPKKEEREKEEFDSTPSEQSKKIP